MRKVGCVGRFVKKQRHEHGDRDFRYLPARTCSAAITMRSVERKFMLMCGRSLGCGPRDALQCDSQLLVVDLCLATAPWLPHLSLTRYARACRIQMTALQATVS